LGFSAIALFIQAKQATGILRLQRWPCLTADPLAFGPRMPAQSTWRAHEKGRRNVPGDHDDDQIFTEFLAAASQVWAQPADSTRAKCGLPEARRFRAWRSDADLAGHSL